VALETRHSSSRASLPLAFISIGLPNHSAPNPEFRRANLNPANHEAPDYAGSLLGVPEHKVRRTVSWVACCIFGRTERTFFPMLITLMRSALTPCLTSWSLLGTVFAKAHVIHFRAAFITMALNQDFGIRVPRQELNVCGDHCLSTQRTSYLS
jgi:hypothetical protein